MGEYFITNYQQAAGPFFGKMAVKASTLVEKKAPSRWRLMALSARPWALLLALCASGGHAYAQSLHLSRTEAAQIGRRIWQNECAGTVSGLTSWNAGEQFASLGIGHFIWYPKGARGPFEESFPDLIAFASSRGVKLPQVVIANQNSGCPWNSRSEFVASSQTPAMKELRAFLAQTVDVQAEFLVQRLQRALPKMLAEVSSADRANVQRQFDRVASTAQGCYALVDYVNFKGEGVLDSERYQGQGWGLLQVLQGMTGTERGSIAVQEFADSARRVLTTRVKNSPPERKESRWLAGWLERVHTYNRS
jgi:hypothetical protein